MTPLNLLVAFPYFKQNVVDTLKALPKQSYRLIVDSGAFTAWNTGKTITLDDYCRFLDSIEHLRPFNAVQLDVFGEPEKTYKNFLVMKKRGYDVMPVFTRGDTLERLEEFYSYSDYLMFGGIVIGGKNEGYVKWFLRNNKGRNTHWLGFVNTLFIKAYRPKSVDSSTWTMCSRVGESAVYLGGGETRRLKRHEFVSVRPPTLALAQARAVGMTESEFFALRYEDAWHGDYKTLGAATDRKNLALRLSVLSYIKQAQEIEERLGTRVYFAAASAQQVAFLCMVREYFQAHAR